MNERLKDIIVEARGNQNWHAYIKNRPHVQGWGTTREEAIGHLFFGHQSVFEIYFEDVTPCNLIRQKGT